VRVIGRRGGRGKRKREIRIKMEMISMYVVMGMLIGLGGTAASREVVNISSVIRIVGVRLLTTIL